MQIHDTYIKTDMQNLIDANAAHTYLGFCAYLQP